MGLFGAIAGGLRKVGSFAEGALKKVGSVAPIVGSVANTLGAVLPGPLGTAAKLVGSAAGKVSEFISAGKAQNLMNRVADVGTALTGLVPNGGGG